MNLYKTYSNNELINLSNINLGFDLKKTNQSSVKDSFIKIIQSPLEFLFSKNDMFHCLQNINFNISEGDLIGLIGRNGAGKTSLCQVISKNIFPTSGTLSVNCEIRGVFSANPQIFPELSGKENAKIVSRLLYPKLSRDEINLIALESLNFAGLKEFEDVPIKKYSKGMSSRLFLSLVTARPTDLLILDEVFDGTDIFFKEKFLPRLENIIKLSKASIFINHDIGMLQKIVNRVVVLEKGKIVFDGNPIKGFFYYHNSK